MERLAEHDRVLFGVATAAGLIHAVDEVFFAREAYRAIPVVVLSLAVLIWWDRLTDTSRGVAGLAFGLFWLAGILTHWVSFGRQGPSPGDWTSFISVPGGLMLLVVGVATLAARDTRPAR
jgi:hypothetical protein